ncbi:MAG: hypothetical protein LQ338_004252 [Usnochroma carphineum]|nr:MAG: hypothetical protein LQ338_004252 [Usnochroma carphineum]
MGLKKGSLADLVYNGAFKGSLNLLDVVSFQILQGLDYLAVQEIVHRDLKPENVLFTVSNDGQDYTLVISDFGLCNFASNALTYAGTPRFMAPEILFNKGQKQTTKVDVWSFFATLAWAGDAAGFSTKIFNTPTEVVNGVRAAAEVFYQLKSMAEVDPYHRASAAQMLVLLYEGNGLTTPRNNVPPLTPIAALQVVDPAPKANTNSGKAQKVPVDKARNVPDKVRTIAKERRIVFDARHRVRKAREKPGKGIHSAPGTRPQ